MRRPGYGTATQNGINSNNSTPTESHTPLEGPPRESDSSEIKNEKKKHKHADDQAGWFASKYRAPSRPAFRRQLFGMLLTLAEAIAFVVSGMYGPLSALGAGNAILIVCQLFLMGVALILMDQVLQKG